jgi:hypothetical protein
MSLTTEKKIILIELQQKKAIHITYLAMVPVSRIFGWEIYYRGTFISGIVRRLVPEIKMDRSPMPCRTN